MSKYGLGADLDKRKTRKFLRRDAHKRCPYCRAKPYMQFINMFSPIFNDGQIFCSACNNYLGIWDENEGYVCFASKEEMMYSR